MAIVLFDEEFIRDCQIRDAMAQGEARGEARGRAEGEAKAKAEFIRNMKAMGFTLEEVAKAANMDVAEVAKI